MSRTGKMNRLLPILTAPLLLSSCVSNQPTDWNGVFVTEPNLPTGVVRASIVPEPISANPLVENGSAYEFVDLRIPASISTLLVPEGCVVRSESNRDLSRIYLEKSLFYMGHPSARMSIEDVRNEMGIAAKIKGTTLKISAYGGWSSFEGGQSVDIAMLIPTEIRVRHYRTKQELNRGDLSESGWRTIEAFPDAERGFESVKATNAQ